MLIARAYRTTGLVQSTEQKELGLSESLTNWILEEFIVKIGKIHCITVANGLSTGTVPDKKNTKKPTFRDEKNIISSSDAMAPDPEEGVLYHIYGKNKATENS